jgi:hypothetical protein
MNDVRQKKWEWVKKMLRRLYHMMGQEQQKRKKLEERIKAIEDLIKE